MDSEQTKKGIDFKRVSSALIGFPLVAAIMILGNKYVISIGFAIIAMIAMNEYLLAVSKKSKPISWVAYLACALISLVCLIPQTMYSSVILGAIFTILLILFAQVIITEMKTNFNDLVYTFVGIIYIPVFLSTIAMLRNLEHGKILIWYVIFAGWATDVFAYAIGKRFGKHKFSKVSPKKSIEGVIAGTLGTVLVSLTYTYFINTYLAVEYSYATISIITLFLSLIGQVGDFAASTIKRYVEIKDYSNLIPGHGGMLDRIDSIMFIAPFAYMMLNLL